MSFLRTGGRRTKVGRVFVTVLSLAAFQVLAIIGAGTASAAPTGCLFDLSNGKISITIETDEWAEIAVETAADNLDAESSTGAILFNNFGTGYENGALSTQCGSATTTNTTSITVLGSPSGDEWFGIDEASGGTFPAATTWAVDEGGNSDVNTGGGDWFAWYGNDNVNSVVTLTNTSFNMNGAAGILAGIERFWMDGGYQTAPGGDIIDGSATTMYNEFYGETATTGSRRGPSRATAGIPATTSKGTPTLTP